MIAEKKKQRLPVLDKIDDILNKNCKVCEFGNRNSMSTGECQGCPILKELRECGRELGWPEQESSYSNSGKKKK